MKPYIKMVHGRTRSVLLVGNLAFKFPFLKEWRMFVRGLIDNMFEVENRHTSKEHLLPILFHLPGGFLNVFPRVKVVEDPEDSQLWEYFNLLYQTDNEPVLNIIECAEHSNYGWYKHQLVCIDYGNGRNYWLNKQIIKDHAENKLTGLIEFMKKTEKRK